MKSVVISVALALGMAASSAVAEEASCKKVRFADVGWTDIQVTTGTAQVILEALGYEPEVKTLSVPVTYASLKNKDLDVFLGNWMPSQAASSNAAACCVSCPGRAASVNGTFTVSPLRSTSRLIVWPTSA